MDEGPRPLDDRSAVRGVLVRVSRALSLRLRPSNERITTYQPVAVAVDVNAPTTDPADTQTQDQHFWRSRYSCRYCRNNQNMYCRCFCNRNNQNMLPNKRQSQPTTRSGSKCALAPPEAEPPGPQFPFAWGRRLEPMRERWFSAPGSRAALHAPALQPSWITALRSAICLLMLRMRRFGHRFRPWRRQIFFRTVGQMSVKKSVRHPRDQVRLFDRRTQDLRSFVDGPVKEGSNTRDISTALGVSAGIGRHVMRLQAQTQTRWQSAASLAGAHLSVFVCDRERGSQALA